MPSQDILFIDLNIAKRLETRLPHILQLLSKYNKSININEIIKTLVMSLYCAKKTL